MDFQTFVSSKDIVEIDFQSLDPDIHEQVDQLKRRINATKIKKENIQVHTDGYLVTGSSGDIYKTTLHSCSCFDYQNRELPCKHMYRLALDKGLISDVPVAERKASRAFSRTIETEIQHFYELYKSRAISAEKYIKIADAISKGK